MPVSTPTIIGILGTVFLLVSFFLNQRGRWNQGELRYDATNALGSACLVFYAVSIDAYPFAVLNGIWFLVSIRDVFKKF